MNKSTKIRAMGIPYWDFRQKIMFTKKFERKYYIEDAICGALQKEE
jgi:hypothetical protein